MCLLKKVEGDGIKDYNELVTALNRFKFVPTQRNLIYI